SDSPFFVPRKYYKRGASIGSVKRFKLVVLDLKRMLMLNYDLSWHSLFPFAKLSGAICIYNKFYMKQNSTLHQGPYFSKARSLLRVFSLSVFFSSAFLPN